MNKQLIQRPAVGLTPAKPVYRKRRRLALAAERQAGHRKSSTTSAPTRSDQLTRAAALPLNRGGASTTASSSSDALPSTPTPSCSRQAVRPVAKPISPNSLGRAREVRLPIE
jgi:hypothetical protein